MKIDREYEEATVADSRFTRGETWKNKKRSKTALKMPRVFKNKFQLIDTEIKKHLKEDEKNNGNSVKRTHVNYLKEKPKNTNVLENYRHLNQRARQTLLQLI